MSGVGGAGVGAINPSYLLPSWLVWFSDGKVVRVKPWVGEKIPLFYNIETMECEGPRIVRAVDELGAWVEATRSKR